MRPSAAAVRSTAVFSVSVANCSRCASWTDSACFSANSRSAPRRSSGSPPPNGKKPPLPSIAPRLRELDQVAGLDLALQLRDRALHGLERGRERRRASRVQLLLEAARRLADRVQALRCGELWGVPGPLPHRWRRSFAFLDPLRA